MKCDRPAIAVFGASSTGPGDSSYQTAEECGRLLGEAGCDVITGGYGGSMEAVSLGAIRTGAEAIGVTAPKVFPSRSAPNRYITSEHPANSLTERIHIMMSLADATIALPGSIGTLTELMVAWNIAFVTKLSGSVSMPVVTVGPLWARIVPALARDLATDDSLITCVATVPASVATVSDRLLL